MGFWNNVYDGLAALSPTNWGGNSAASAANSGARDALAQNGVRSSGFGNANANNYANGTIALGGATDMLRDQAQGKNLLAPEQLRQALMTNQAAQHSASLSASPANQAMAMRTAAIQGAHLSSANAGQSAMAAQAEKNAAQQAYVQALLGQRQQDLQGTLGGYSTSNQAYAGGLNPEGDKSWSERNAGALSAGAGLLGVISDKRQKEDIEDGDAKARSLLEGLKPYTFKYKKGARELGAGEGEQLGVMAQDLEKVAPHTIRNTSIGKVVDGGKLAAALAATLPGLNKRLRKLEGDE